MLIGSVGINVSAKSVTELQNEISKLEQEAEKIENDLKAKKEELTKINKEIDDILGIKFVAPSDGKKGSASPTSRGSHFTEADRM